MKVSIYEIKKAIGIILDKAVQVGHEEIDVDTDFYWKVCSVDRTNLQKEVTSMCVGSISDDLNELSKLLTDDGMATVVDFDRAGNLLIEIGEQISKSTSIY